MLYFNLSLRRFAGTAPAWAAVGFALAFAFACPAPAWAQGFVGSNAIQQGTDMSAVGSARAFSQTATAAGTINRLSVFLDPASTASRLTLGLYANSGSRPGRRLAVCGVTTPRAGGWNSCPISPRTITMHRYWAAVLQPAGSTGTIRFRGAVSGGGASYSSSSSTLSALPSNFGAGLRGSGSPVSIFADLAPTPTQNPTPVPTPSPTPTPTPTATPTPTPPPTSSPTLQQVDGGPGWYGGFSNPLPTDASYFPIGVWFESVLSQADVDKDKEVGLNTYVVLTTNSNLSLLRTNGMRAFVQQDQWLTSTALGTETPGWLLNDEIDMEMSPDAGYAELLRLLGTLPADGRLRFNNYGKGVMFWETDAQAARYVNAVQLASNDIYWFTDPHVCGISEGGAMFTGRTRALTAAECRRAANYGYVVDRMRSLVSPARSRPVWAFVEVGHPFTESSAPTIQAPEIRAAVWHSLIAGARGIMYFNHNFGGPCTSQHVLRDACGAAVRPTVKAVNEQVKRLAPVLNAPSVAGLASTTAQVRTMVKYQGGKFYVFAGNKELGARTATFDVPCVGDATVTVVDEGRTIPLTGGRFTDSFADGNAVHIYRIDGGSTCGLPPS